MAVVTKLVIDSFKRISAVSIEPEGNLVRITGRNGAGKSSVLDAIFAALCGKDAVPSKPVKRGAAKGTVTVHLDDPKVVITRTFAPDGASTLVIESHDGARFPSPQTMLDKLLGKITFDPLAFLAKKPAAQVETLLSVVELKADPARLEELSPKSAIEDPVQRLSFRAKQTFEERTVQNGLVAQAEAELKALPVGEGEAPNEAVNVTALVRERDELKKEQARQAEVDAACARWETQARDIRSQIESLKNQLEVVEARAESARVDCADFEDQAPAIADLDERIDTAEAVNERYALEQKRKAVAERLVVAIAAAAEKTATLDAIKAYKEKLVAEADMPVPGLGFTGAGADAYVTFNNVPLDQASQAEQIRVSAALAMAVNPALKVMLVREGSLLDEDGVKLLAELAAAKGFQVWMEVVDSSGKVGVVIEDGAVKAVNKEAPRADAG